MAKATSLYRLLTWLPMMAFIIVLPHALRLARFNIGNLFVVQAIIQQYSDASNRAQRIFSTLVASDLAPFIYRSQARLALLEARFVDAKKYGEQALALAPFDWQIHDLLGRTYWALGEKAAARHLWQAMDQIRPRLSYLNHAGWQSFAQSDYASGIAYFKQGIDYDPEWTIGYWALSSYYWQEGQVEQATPYLLKLAQLLPQNDAQRRFIVGRLRLLDGNLSAAGEQFCKAWQQVPDETYWYSCLWVLWQQGMIEQGWTIMTQAAGNHPEQTAITALEWGNRFFDATNYPEAAKFYKVACQIKGTNDESCIKQIEAEQLSARQD